MQTKNTIGKHGLHSGTVILAPRQFKVQENLLCAKCPCVHCPVALATALLNSSMEARAENYLKQFVFHFDIYNLPPDEKNLQNKNVTNVFFFFFLHLMSYFSTMDFTVVTSKSLLTHFFLCHV